MSLNRTALKPSDEPPSILTKAFDLLRTFDTNTRVLTLSELSRASGPPKSTAHRAVRSGRPKPAGGVASDTSRSFGWMA
ncbi:helix-turn-helix domain-containing protein [Cumulibacter soli]|uniref:helix-turn-helix domain-containing protein n=1 Tax=Cumulibacter soli TaxID=2546344 RepID=UPI0010682695